MLIDMTQPIKAPPRRVLPGVLEKIKGAYILWHEYHNTLPKTERYSLGNKIDKLFIETMELISYAGFLSGEEKIPYLKAANRKFDTLRILLMILWEIKSLDNKRYIALSLPLDEVGKMLGGWIGQTIKQNSLAKAREK